MAHASPEPGLHAVDVLERALRVPPAVSSRGPQWRDVTTCLWRTPWISSYELVESDELIVALHTGGQRSVRARIGGKWSTTVSNPGHVHVIPAGERTGFKPEGQLEFVPVHIGAKRIASLSERDPGAASSVPFRFAFHDPFVGACIQALSDEMRAPREQGALFVDSVTDALTLHLLRTPAPRAVSGRARETLSRTVLTRICEKIEASLESGLSLDELAAEAKLSRFHFARAFREAMGMPPHRYVTLRRVEHAKHLLRHTDLPLVEIALAAGFGNQSHFTLRFREAVGETPRRFRESS